MLTNSIVVLTNSSIVLTNSFIVLTNSILVLNNSIEVVVWQVVQDSGFGRITACDDPRSFLKEC